MKPDISLQKEKVSRRKLAGLSPEMPDNSATDLRWSATSSKNSIKETHVRAELTGCFIVPRSLWRV
jgi:hypothetical protein